MVRHLDRIDDTFRLSDALPSARKVSASALAIQASELAVTSVAVGSASLLHTLLLYPYLYSIHS